MTLTFTPFIVAIDFWHAVIISLLQGAFELVPVSSLGHTVLVPSLLGWDEWKADDPNNASFVAFVVVLHLGTAIALLTFFWRDWVRVIQAFVRTVRRRSIAPDDPDERMAWLIIVGSIPAGLLGLIFQKPLESLFDKGIPVAIFLMLNGLMMLGGEQLRQRQTVPEAVVWQPDGTAAVKIRGIALTEMSLRQGLGVGAMQALALFPGFSRSGASIVGGLLTGLRHSDAAKLSFMLGTPLIIAANIIKLPHFLRADATAIGPGLALMGFVISGVTAYLAIRFLMKYFETERLDPFGWYCLGFGAFCLTVFVVRGG